MDKYQRYVEQIGFSGLAPLATRNKALLRAFKYEEFDSPKVRAILGKSTRNKDGRYVYKLARDKAIRVDLGNKQILLGNTPRVVKAFLASVGG